MLDIEDLTIQLYRVELKPNDVLFLRCVGDNWTQRMVDRLTQFVGQAFPNNKCIVGAGGALDIQIVSQVETNKIQLRKPPERIIELP